MADIIMLAEPAKVDVTPGPQTTHFFSTTEFFTQEDLIKSHDNVLWQAFHTHGKYQKIVRHADWFCVAVDTNNNYLASAFVVELGSKWLIEYVMADPTSQNKGAGSSVMARIMQEAKERTIDFAILNCDSQKDSGKLPAFYNKFGFRQA